MTLIAFATYGDHAEIITDSTSYTRYATNLGRCTKSQVIHHLDAAVMAQGDSTWGSYAKAAALQASAQVATFDELVDSAQGWLQEMWETRTREFPTTPSESVAFLIGYSPRAGAFAAYMFAAEQDFKPVKVSRTFAMPTPWSNRPSGMELRRVRAFEGDEDPRIVQALEAWSHNPPLTAPGSVDEWVDLAKRIREQRALHESRLAHVIVAGDVFHTRLSRGEVTIRKVHTFNDEGEELLRLIQWTSHPLAQVMDCHCGSGKWFVDCHYAPWVDRACDCGSGKAFAACCKVTAPATAGFLGREPE